ncbi:alpha/beta-hydrolase [Rhizodiscina lignyota]|uniref:Alpha/beta-hydrolase n=1 Tax=Rhizodiscina lignyota TaxID=1504668 RepID=A0A9P4M4G1_9PEZI|nr:alpha/beta-hydrolase [Rhizodiscina lignyota]
MEASAEQMMRLSDAVEICYQTFGSPRSPPILLLAGASQSMLAWNADFIAKLSPSSNPHFVIRYDYRDTGRSTHYPVLPQDVSPQEITPHYTLTGLCNDAIALLDHLKIDSANFVGFSMGGGIACYIAGELAPKRVRSLALLSTSPVGPAPGPDDGLSPMSPELLDEIRALHPPNDWHEKIQVVAFLTEVEKLLQHVPPTVEEEVEARELLERIFDRTQAGGDGLQCIYNHGPVVFPCWPREALRHVRCPTVVIHGRSDRNFALPHAEALAKEIEGAKLVVLDDMAHELPRRCWDRIAQEIVDTSS